MVLLKFGIFIRRYKRFFVDLFYNGNIVTCHNPNTGSMKNLLLPGAPVCFSESSNEKRKLKYTLEGIFIDNQWIHTNTLKVNEIVYNSILDGSINEFYGANLVKREFTIGKKRIDFYIEKGENRFLVEVKSVSLFDEKYSMFPDAITKRGQEHLETLRNAFMDGYSPILLYIIQSDRKYFRCAEEIDFYYCKLYKEYVYKYIKPLFYRNIFDPHQNSFRILKVDTD